MNTLEIIKKEYVIPKHLVLLDVVESEQDLEHLFIRHRESFKGKMGKKKKNKTISIFQEWVFKNDDTHKKVICFYEDPDDFTRNDSWGHKEIHKVIIVKNVKKHTVIGSVVEDLYF